MPKVGNGFAGGPQLFEHSSHSHANISRTKRGATLTIAHNRHVTTPLTTRRGFPGKVSFAGGRLLFQHSEF